MKQTFVVAIRNDQGQILVLETLAGEPALPGGELSGSRPVMAQVQDHMARITGLVVSNVHLTSTNKTRGLEVSRFSCFAVGGRLAIFKALYASASWIAFRLAVRIQGLSTEDLAMLKDVAWLGRTALERSAIVNPVEEDSRPRI